MIFNNLGNTSIGVTAVGNKIIQNVLVEENINTLSEIINDNSFRYIFNALEIDWNKAYLPLSLKNENKYLYKTSKLLEIIDRQYKILNKIKYKIGISKYYFYIGDENPMNMNSIEGNIIRVANRGNETSGGWFEIGDTLGTYNSDNKLYNWEDDKIMFTERVYPYVALPNNTLQIWNGLGASALTEWTYIGTKILNNITYYIYKRNLKVRRISENIY